MADAPTTPRTPPADAPLFQHVVIVGVGLLGTSLGLALKNRRLARWVTGVGRAGSSSLDVAKARGAVDAVATDLAAAARGGATVGADIPPADLIVLCTPIRQFPDAFRALAPALAPGAIVTDVGSTKADVVKWAAELLPPSVCFVGSHPMAGSEKSGPAAARETLYENAVCLICPPPPPPPAPPPDGRPSSAGACERVRQLWRAVGMRLIDVDADRHDRWVAAVSHLPHAAAFALVRTAAADPRALDAVAGGFLDTTRVASSDPAMWTDIFLTNRDAVLSALDDYTRELAALRAAVAAGDEPALRAYVAAAKAARDDLLTQRLAAGLPVRSAACQEPRP
jgi:prephenate dehydrogenase